MGNGQLLGLPGPPMQGVQIAQPMNDTQLIALVAAQCALPDGGADPKAAVEWAVDIVAWSVLAVNGGGLGGRIKELQKALQETAADDN